MRMRYGKKNGQARVVLVSSMGPPPGTPTPRSELNNWRHLLLLRREIKKPSIRSVTVEAGHEERPSSSPLCNGDPAASSSRSSATKPTRARKPRSVADVHSRDIATANLERRSPSVAHAADHTSRPAVRVEFSIPPRMHNTPKIFQLNVQEQRAVQHSVINDNILQKFAALALSGSYCF